MGEGYEGYLFSLSHTGLQPGGQDAFLPYQPFKRFLLSKTVKRF